MTRREVPRPEHRCPRCRYELDRFWYFCPNCACALTWRDLQQEPGTECRSCRRMLSDRHSFFPWRGRDIADSDPSLEPLRALKAFMFARRCRRCGGGLP